MMSALVRAVLHVNEESFQPVWTVRWNSASAGSSETERLISQAETGHNQRQPGAGDVSPNPYRNSQLSQWPRKGDSHCPWRHYSYKGCHILLPYKHWRCFERPNSITQC